MKVTVILVVTGALVTVPKSLEKKRQAELELTRNIEKPRKMEL